MVRMGCDCMSVAVLENPGSDLGPRISASGFDSVLYQVRHLHTKVAGSIAGDWPSGLN